MPKKRINKIAKLRTEPRNMLDHRHAAAEAPNRKRRHHHHHHHADGPIDTTPPVVTVSANPTMLWPPNGAMVPVTISGAITDCGSGVNAKTAAYAVRDEYGQVQPSGPMILGMGGSYSTIVSLQASREGSDKDGRQYIITVSAKDIADNLGSASTVVTVPHDQPRPSSRPAQSRGPSRRQQPGRPGGRRGKPGLR